VRQDPCGVNELLHDNCSFMIGSINQTQHLAGL
jgi:hypothetical protein